MRKTCRDCGQIKPLDDFHRKKQSKDGRCNSCKACRNAAASAWREAHPEYMREWGEKNRWYIRARARANRELRAEASGKQLQTRTSKRK